MSNFTDFFPAAGGGGGIGKSITVNDYTYANSQTLANFTSNRFSIASRSNNDPFGLSYSDSNPTGYSVNPVNTTYVTIADITNATDGGGLYGCWGWTLDTNSASRYFTIKITIDGGTPVEYAFHSNAVNKSFINYIGMNYIMSTYSESTSYPYAIVSQDLIRYTNGLPLGIRYAYDTNTNSWFSYTSDSQIRGTMAIINANLASQRALPFVYFSSSCKVEIKMNTGTPSQFYGGAEILTF